MASPPSLGWTVLEGTTVAAVALRLLTKDYRQPLSATTTATIFIISTSTIIIMAVAEVVASL